MADQVSQYTEQFSKVVALPGMGGLNVLDDPEFINDNELEIAQNVVYNNGVLTPRQGSYLFASKPSNETGTPISLIKLRASDKTDFLIAKYGSGTAINYYLWDFNNSGFIKINGSYLPSSTLPDAYTAYNNGQGVGNDFGYGGNGTDNTWKWPMALTTLNGATAGGNGYVDVSDGSKFSFSGVLNGTTLLIQDGSTLRSYTATTVDMVLGLSTQPTNGQVINLFINGNSAIVITFVSSIGANAGNVLIGANAAATQANLLGLLQAPGTTNANQVALSAGNQTLVGYFTWSSSGTSIYGVPGGSATSFYGTTNVIGNSITATRINISGTVGATISSGSGVTLGMIDKGSAFPKGNIFLSSQKRLFISGGYYSANEVFYSKTSTPDDFTTTSGITGAGSELISDSEGPIQALYDFGTFIAIVKQNKVSQWTFIYDSALDAKLVNIIPAAQGQDVGMFAPFTGLSANNTLIYPTASQGITQLIPAATGTTFTIEAKTDFSEKILPLCTDLYSFLNGRSISFNQQWFFSAGIPSVNYTTSPNSVSVKNTDVLVYDTTFQAWSIIKGWGVQDWANYNATLLFLSNVDGNIYQVNVGYDDNAQAYLVSASTKKFNFDNAVLPKTINYIPIRGKINKGGEFTIDVIFEQPGGTLTQSYTINSDLTASDGTPLINFPTVIPLGGNSSIGGDVPLGGGVDSEDETSDTVVKGDYNLWLDVSAAIGFLTVQVVISSETAGTYWEFKIVGFDPMLEGTHPAEFTISPSASS